MNCVYTAWEAALDFEGLPKSDWDWFIYRAVKRFCQGPRYYEQDTWGGAVPLMYRLMALRFKGHVWIEVRHRVFTKAVQFSDAENWQQRLVAKITNYGLTWTELHLHNSVYLMLGQRHAAFMREAPDDSQLPVMAISIWRRA